MGHVESGGEAATEDLTVWALWKRLVALFPTWSLLPEGFVTPGAWGYLGVDFVSGFRRNVSTRKTFELMHAHADDLAFLMSLEMGKSLTDARGEVTYSAEFFRWFAE